MDKDRIIIGIIIIALGIYLGFYFGFFSILGNEFAGYKNVNFDGLNLVYSTPVSPDNNYFYNTQAFRQWTDGNVVSFNFYQNAPFLQFYLLANGINPNDFEIIAGNLDCFGYNDLLRINYCKVPTEPNVEKTYTDDDGCQHYKILSSVKTLDCLCSNNIYVPKVCGVDVASWTCFQCGPCAYGALNCQIWDCSTYETTVINEDFGGTINGVARNYKNLFSLLSLTQTLTGNKCIGNDPQRCCEYSNKFILSGAMSSVGIDAIKNNYICEATGILSDSTAYDKIGTVDWSDATNGLTCTISGNPSLKVNDGIVTFKKAAQRTFYRFSSNTCSPITLLELAATEDDYLTLESCQVRITNTTTNIFYYYDNTNKDCEAKEFTGMYMYEGLHTFANQQDCFNELGINQTSNQTTNTTATTTTPAATGGGGGSSYYKAPTKSKTTNTTSVVTAQQLQAQKDADNRQKIAWVLIGGVAIAGIILWRKR